MPTRYCKTIFDKNFDDFNYRENNIYLVTWHETSRQAY
jgi:hypothetical protein